jgi:hypothetical protein
MSALLARATVQRAILTTTEVADERTINPGKLARGV